MTYASFSHSQQSSELVRTTYYFNSVRAESRNGSESIWSQSPLRGAECLTVVVAAPLCFAGNWLRVVAGSRAFPTCQDLPTSWPAWTQSALLSPLDFSTTGRPMEEEQGTEIGARNVGKLKIITFNFFADARYAQSFESPWFPTYSSLSDKSVFIVIVSVGIGVAFILWLGIILYVCYSRKLYAR